MDSFTSEDMLKLIDDRWNVILEELKTKNGHLEKEAVEHLVLESMIYIMNLNPTSLRF